MVLQGIEQLKTRMERRARIVDSKSHGLAAVVFRKYEAVEFYYDGESRTGVVWRIDADAVLVQDDAKGDSRLFEYAEVEGQPIRGRCRDPRYYKCSHHHEEEK